MTECGSNPLLGMIGESLQRRRASSVGNIRIQPRVGSCGAYIRFVVPRLPAATDATLFGAFIGRVAGIQPMKEK